MTGALPTVRHIYQNHHLDSARWERYVPRDDDIVVSTSYKSGTTWTQEILLHLVFLGQKVPLRNEVSPWLDFRLRPLDEVIDLLENQSHQRFIKTHLALDGLPFYPQVKYIVVGRDPRDVFMSLWNHYSSYTDETYELLNETPGRVGAPFPRCPEDIHDLWRLWITRGWFEWESEGYPAWGNMHHVQTWWEYRHLDNILLLHYADLLADPQAQIRRIAAFLSIPVSEEQAAAIANQTTLTAMRTRYEQAEGSSKILFKDGARTFYYKGTNGRWRDVLTDEELALYRQTAAKLLTLDCAAWLERE